MIEKRYFEFSAAWQKGSDDVADISLRLGDQVLSRIADTEKETNRDHFRASATSLALWFSDNWWRLRWETLRDGRYPSVDWRLRHELNSAGGGALWPPVTIFSSGDRVAFAPSVGSKAIAGPQTYFDFSVAMVLAKEYEAELDRFFDAVVQHCAQSVDGKVLASVLRQVRTERDDPELAGWRRLEACLGYDPDEAPDAVVEALIDLEGTAGEDGVEEAARARPGPEAGATLAHVIEATKASSVTVDLTLADALQRKWNLPAIASPWQMAEAAAAELRDIVGVQHGRLDHDFLAGIFKARWEELKSATATARQLPYGARMAEGSGCRLSLQTRTSHDRRFELSRVFGDAVWQGAAKFGIVSRSKSDRQKFQRAFAHSLLCPFDDLEGIIDVNDPTPEFISAAARRFLVHESVVRNQLVYKGYLPFENTSEATEAA